MTTGPGRFADREAAGRRLGRRLGGYAEAESLLVVGVPTGGVEVANAVAETLGAGLAAVAPGAQPPSAAGGRPVILVDEGLEGTLGMRAAVDAVRSAEPLQLVVAVPVADPGAASELRRDVDRVVCLLEPEPFISVGQWYDDFRPVSVQRVSELLDHRRPDAA
ncbi:MAG: hypothetical protein ACTHNU_08125 [Gaiellales bacterium]